MERKRNREEGGILRYVMISPDLDDKLEKALRSGLDLSEREPESFNFRGPSV